MMQWGVYPLLEDLEDQVGDVELVEHVRRTGTLYSDTLMSGEVPRSFYNPAPMQRIAYLNDLQRVRLREANLRRRGFEQLSERDRLDKIKAEYAALEAWRAHQDEVNAHMRMAHRYAEMLRAG